MNLEQLVRNMVVENVTGVKPVQVELTENEVRLAAIQKLKEIQAQITEINFLDVVAVMRPENPLKKDVEAMEIALADVRAQVEKFVVDNQFDAVEAEQQANEEEPEEESTEEPEEETPEESEEEPEEVKESAALKLELLNDINQKLGLMHLGTLKRVAAILKQAK